MNKISLLVLTKSDKIVGVCTIVGYVSAMLSNTYVNVDNVYIDWWIYQWFFRKPHRDIHSMSISILTSVSKLSNHSITGSIIAEKS